MVEGLFANTIDKFPTFQYSGSGKESRILSGAEEHDLTFTGALPKNIFKYANTVAFPNAFYNINILPVSVANYMLQYYQDGEQISNVFECYAFVPSGFT